MRTLLSCMHFGNYRKRHASQCATCVRCYRMDHPDVRVREAGKPQLGFAAREEVERCTFMRVAPTYQNLGNGLMPGGAYHPTTGLTSPRRDLVQAESTVYRPCMSVTAHCPKKIKTSAACEDSLAYFPRFADTHGDHNPQRRFMSSPMMMVQHYQRLMEPKRCAELSHFLDQPEELCNSTAWRPSAGR